MISNNDLLQMKERLLVAAQATKRMVESNEPTIHYDEQEYWRVHIAFAYLQSDVAAVLAELDTLRAMFVDRVNEFLAGGELTDAISSSGGNEEDSRNLVAGVPDAVSAGGGEPPQHDEAAVGSPVPAKRPYRRRKPRSKPAGDSSGVPPVQSPVDG